MTIISKGERKHHPFHASTLQQQQQQHQNNNTHSHRMIMRVRAFALIVATALFADTGSRTSNCPSGVAAFQSPSPNNHHGRPQMYPQQSRIAEPQQKTTSDFPKTNPPQDRRDKKSSMFSPMDRNERTKSSRQQKGPNRQNVVKSIWETSAPVLVEASSLHTFDFEKPTVERVQVLLKKADMDPMSGKRSAAGEPLIARVDLWHGPDSTPQNLAIYLEEEEDEDYYHEDMKANTDTPFSTIIETPQGHNTIAIRNIAETSDLLACVQEEECEHDPYDTSWYDDPSTRKSTKNDSPLQSVIQRLKATTTPQRIDSTTARREETQFENDEEDNEAVVGSCAVELPSNIASVQVLLQTEYMQPLQARIELELRMTEDEASSLDSDNYKVVKRTIVEVYSEDGMHRPFFAVLEAPRKRVQTRKGGSSSEEGKQTKDRGWFGNTNNNNRAYYTTSMRVVNLSTTEFPLYATVEPHAIDPVSTETSNRDEAKTKPSSSSEEQGAREDEDVPPQQEWTHFGGGSNYNMGSNSTILDAEIL